MSFSGRQVPRLWSDDVRESELASAGREALYAAFLLFTAAAFGRSAMLHESWSEDGAALKRQLADMASLGAADLEAGDELTKRMELEVPAR